MSRHSDEVYRIAPPDTAAAIGEIRNKLPIHPYLAV